MNVQDLAEECAAHIQDPDFAEVPRERWLLFIRSASRDLDTHGWLIRTSDDTSIVAVANTYTYAIPQPFAYIKELRMEDLTGNVSVFTRFVPYHHWEVHVENGIPILFFNTISALEVGRHLMIVGQKRPSTYTNLGEIIDQGCEAVLRERAIAYAARSAAAGVSELSKWRQIMAGQAMAASEAMMRSLPQEFRVQPTSIVVPGRET